MKSKTAGARTPLSTSSEMLLAKGFAWKTRLAIALLKQSPYTVIQTNQGKELDSIFKEFYSKMLSRYKKESSMATPLKIQM